MNLLLAASEAVPFCKTGGLADVAMALPIALAADGHTVSLFVPLYRPVRPQLSSATHLVTLNVGYVSGLLEPVKIWALEFKPRLTVYFVDSPPYFDREGIYGPTPASSYDDNDCRFALFSAAVLETAIALNLKPDVIHAHDWQTGLLPVYLKEMHGNDAAFASTATVFTIHNMAYQGNFPGHYFRRSGLPPHVFSTQGVEFYGQFSFMKAGLNYADALSTVSPTYAREIRSDVRFGCGMEGLLAHRQARLSGILNGLDIDAWNPSSDPYLAASISASDFSQRARLKADLQQAAALPVHPDIPVFGFVGRLDDQKGIDVILDTIPDFLAQGAQLITLGQGQPSYMNALATLSAHYPNQVKSETRFAEALAHKIYGGCDIFLMPSRYEPCGLSQLIAMRYGALPVVTPTGGLLDTVAPLSADGRQGTGFVAHDGSKRAFYEAMQSSVAFWRKRDLWKTAQRRCMGADYSWSRSLPAYTQLYQDALRWRRG